MNLKGKRIVVVIALATVVCFSNLDSASAIGLSPLPPPPVVRVEPSYQKVQIAKLIPIKKDRIVSPQEMVYKSPKEILILIYLTDPRVSANKEVLKLVKELRGGSWETFIASAVVIGIIIVMFSFSEGFVGNNPGWGLGRPNPIQPPSVDPLDRFPSYVRVLKSPGCPTLGATLELEVISDPKYLLPDPLGTLKAAEFLIKKGFTVLPYINSDPMLALHLEDLGCATVMPLGSPIGSGQGLNSLENIQIMIENASVPVIIDAGIRTPSQVAQAMEIGADGVLLNTAVAQSKIPGQMALAMKLAVQAGRLGYLAGQMKKKYYASASSPLEEISKFL